MQGGKVEYVLTAKYLEGWLRTEYDTRPWSRARRWAGLALGAVLIPLALISLWRLFHGENQNVPEWTRMMGCLSLVQLLVGLVFFFHRPLSLAWRRRLMRSMMGRRFDFTWSEEGLGGSSLGTSLVLPWSFLRIHVTPGQGVLLRYQGYCYWLPEESLSPEARQWFSRCGKGAAN